jgi:L-lactate permease
MLGLGYVTKYSGTDATLGLALAKTGVLYPFFGTMLGWLGVALTGSTQLRMFCSAASKLLLQGKLTLIPD